MNGRYDIEPAIWRTGLWLLYEQDVKRSLHNYVVKRWIES